MTLRITNIAPIPRSETIQGWRDFLLGDAPTPPVGEATAESAEWLAQCKFEGLDAGARDDYVGRLAVANLNYGLRLLAMSEGSDYFPHKRAAEEAAALSDVMSAAAVAAPVKRGRL